MKPRRSPLSTTRPEELQLPVGGLSLPGPRLIQAPRVTIRPPTTTNYAKRPCNITLLYTTLRSQSIVPSVLAMSAAVIEFG